MAFDAFSAFHTLIDDGHHFPIQPIDLPAKQVDFIGSSVQANCFTDGCPHKCQVGSFVLLIEAVDCADDSCVECVLIYCKRGFAVSLSIIQAADAAPNNPLFSSGCPGHALIAASAFGADHHIGQCIPGVFPCGCGCRFGGVWLTVHPLGKFFLRFVKEFPADDSDMAVLHIVHGASPCFCGESC